MVNAGVSSYFMLLVLFSLFRLGLLYFGKYMVQGNEDG